MDKNLWVYKTKRKSTPQSLISMYIVTSAVIGVLIFLGTFAFARSTYGEIPKLLSIFAIASVILCPVGTILWNYGRNSGPDMIIRAYPIYLDEDDQLWMFDYNSYAFEKYYEYKTRPADGSKRKVPAFSGNHKERTVEYCIATNAVQDIIDNYPFDSYAHNIIQVGKIIEKGNYLFVEMLCHSQVTGKNYPAKVAFPIDMEGLDELREILERMAASEEHAMVQPKEHNGPGIMRIDRIYDDENNCAIVYGIMQEGTITRGDRVYYADTEKNVLFECRVVHIYRDGHEIVWATPVHDGNDPGYEVHIKGRTSEEFAAGNYLLSKK